MQRLCRLLVLCLIGGWASTASAQNPVLALGPEPDSGFDPIRGWGSHGAGFTHSTLLRRDLDLSLIGDLAIDWSLSEDRLTWTVGLRDDARFSDGSPLTAVDVAFTFETAKRAGEALDLTNLASVTATDPQTVVFTLETPQITFVSMMASLGIVSAEAYDGGVAPMGSGPLMLFDRTAGAQAIFEPNPHHHGDAVAFDRLTLLFAGEEAALVAARAGQVDLIAAPPLLGDAVPPGMRRVVTDSVDNRGILFPTRPDTGATDADGNPLGNDVTADPTLRRVITASIDRELLVAGVLNGHGRPAFGPADGLPWDQPEARLPMLSQADAISQLEAAGWTSTGGGEIRSRDGVEARFTLLYPASDLTRQGLALATADLLLTLGIAVEVEGAGWDVIDRRKGADAVLFGWGSHDPQEVFNLYSSRTAHIGWYNPGGYGNPVVDAHFDAAQRSESLEASLPHWRAAAWDGETGFGPRGDAAWAWLVNVGHVYFVDECLDIGPRQVEPHGHGLPVAWNIADWRWIC